MAKTVVGDDYNKTVLLISEALEPKMKKLVDEANKILAKRNVRIGASIQWFIESTDDEKTSEEKRN